MGLNLPFITPLSDEDLKRIDQAGRHILKKIGIRVHDADVLDMLKEADWIIMDIAKKRDIYHKTWQIFGVFLPVKSVGVMGDARTYENVVALRAVTSRDGMTADWYPFPHDFLGRVSTRIINEVNGVNRVTYDISSKPPATIEWE